MRAPAGFALEGKACPFCGAIGGRGGYGYHFEGGRAYIFCVTCKARGPECADSREAIKAWNLPPRVRPAIAALLFVLGLAGCGAVTAGDVDAVGPELAEHDAGAAEATHLEAPSHDAATTEAPLEAPPHDAAAECPPTTLSCLGVPGACPAGMALAKRSECGGAPFPVCCPANVCELSACEQRCPACP